MLHESKTHQSGQFPKFRRRSVAWFNRLIEITMAQHMLKTVNVFFCGIVGQVVNHIPWPLLFLARVGFRSFVDFSCAAGDPVRISLATDRKDVQDVPNQEMFQCAASFLPVRAKGRNAFYVSNNLPNLHKKDAPMTSRLAHCLSSQKQTTDLATPKTGAQIIDMSHIQNGNCSSNPTWFQPSFPLVAHRFPGELTWFQPGSLANRWWTKRAGCSARSRVGRLPSSEPCAMNAVETGLCLCRLLYLEANG